MKRIFDPTLLDFYLQKHEIPSLFDTPDLAFSLYQFEKGERLDTLNPEEYLSFRVDGSIEISANRADGTSYPIGYLDGFTCIGDMEFCGKRDDTHQIEARTTALCIVLPLASTKELLLNDNRFLRYLLNSVTEKLMLYSSSQSNFPRSRNPSSLISQSAVRIRRFPAWKRWPCSSTAAAASSSGF